MEAIHCANGTPASDVINLTGSTYTLTWVDNDGNASGDTGLPVIDAPSTAGTLTINGNDSVIERSSAAGTPDFRIFTLAGGDLTLNRLTVRNGHLSGHNGGGFSNNAGKLTLNDSTVTGNSADYGGAIIFLMGWSTSRIRLSRGMGPPSPDPISGFGGFPGI